MATHSSVLAWRIPGTGEPGGLPSMGSQSLTRLMWLSSSSRPLLSHRSLAEELMTERMWTWSDKDICQQLPWWSCQWIACHCRGHSDFLLVQEDLTCCGATKPMHHNTEPAIQSCPTPFPSPGDLPNPGIEPRSPTLQADCLPAEPQGKPKNIGGG